VRARGNVGQHELVDSDLADSDVLLELGNDVGAEAEAPRLFVLRVVLDQKAPAIRMELWLI
jgi:hypothetical protein